MNAYEWAKKKKQMLQHTAILLLVHWHHVAIPFLKQDCSEYIQLLCLTTDTAPLPPHLYGGTEQAGDSHMDSS